MIFCPRILQMRLSRRSPGIAKSFFEAGGEYANVIRKGQACRGGLLQFPAAIRSLTVTGHR
jgi:hypothetical protein